MKDCKDNEDLTFHKMNWNNVFMNCIASSCPVFLRRPAPGGGETLAQSVGWCRHVRASRAVSTLRAARNATPRARGGAGARCRCSVLVARPRWAVTLTGGDRDQQRARSLAGQPSLLHVVTWRHVMSRHPASNKLFLDTLIWKNKFLFFCTNFLANFMTSSALF